MTTSSKLKENAVSQCRGVEKLAEAIEKINGHDAELANHLGHIKCQMRAARNSICAEDDITQEAPLPTEQK
tara:strand:+ start:38 stop:250 length:213 start_codon:yes stop_codon:yes gene_type:complete